jgi:very-short-patch-repair endonuclease
LAEVGEGFMPLQTSVAAALISRQSPRMQHHRTPPPTHRKFARAMRNDSTKAENMLWQQLRNRQMEGHKFRRQVPVDGYILDFVCVEVRLVIEVDGSQHAESRRDEERDAYFRAQGFQVIRFWNEEIEKGLDFVCRSILVALKDRGE